MYAIIVNIIVNIGALEGASESLSGEKFTFICTLNQHQ